MRRLLFLFLLCSLSFAQKNTNPQYPRTAILQFGLGVTDWSSRFDLVISSPGDNLKAGAIQIAHPATYVLATTDWNAAVPFVTTAAPGNLPVEWRCRTASGSYILNGGFYLADITSFCATHNGERYNQALARVLADSTDWTGFDGVNSDGFGVFPYGTSGTGIDLDRNGLNDYTEGGKGGTWIGQQWKAGGEAFLDSLRVRYQAKFGYQKIITYWSLTDTGYSTRVNGAGWENSPDHGPTIASWIPIQQILDASSRTPRISYVCAGVRYDSVNAPARKKDYFRFMRWRLTTTLMTNAYFMMDDDAGFHWYNFYYDEYDLKLGYPTGVAQQLTNGCWIRFFDSGVAITNPTNSTLTVNSDTLAGRTGYSGPYYRFKGNQDTAQNNGRLFSSVALTSTVASWPSNTQNVGDGIILSKTQRASVCDIIVDNAYSATTPGSASAVMTGFSWDSFAQGVFANPLWSIGPHFDYPQYPETWRSQYAAAGTGSATAVFTPTLNRGGPYRVYEWHGWFGSATTPASNVPCTIVHSNGSSVMTDTLRINQSINYGQWNLLGTFQFSSGAGSVTITNRANGYVIADAFKFVYAPCEY